MWISQKAWLATQEGVFQMAADLRAAREQMKQQETTLAWFMHRLTQVEKERSQLIHMYTGVKVEAPSYEPADPEKDGASLIQKNPLNALPSFSDVGDDEALKLGIAWNDEGEVIYGTTK